MSEITLALIVVDNSGKKGSSWAVVALVLAIVVLPVVVGLLWRLADRLTGVGEPSNLRGPRRAGFDLTPAGLGVVCVIAACVLVGVLAGMPKPAGAVVIIALLTYMLASRPDRS